MLPVANILQPLIDVLHQILLFFHDTVGTGWGLAIILLTLTIRIALLPLTLKQSKSLRSLQVLQPQIKELQAKYKGDKQRLNQEMMKFYQENKVNPLASCLPLALQLPFFISLFYMLRHDLRFDICPEVQQGLAHGVTKACGPGGDAGFLGIPDLTAPAHGAVLVILLILYVGTQLVSGLITMASADKTQRNIMLALPIVFATFVITFPAGLVVYWITTNVWTILQQWIVRRQVGGPIKPATAGDQAEAKPAGSPNPILALIGGGRGGGGGSGSEPAGSDGSGNGAGSKAKAKSGAGTTNGRSGSTPPPPPRRRKKRSGRRR